MPNQSPAPVAGAVELAIDALEKLNQRPRPMCRECADNDGTCPNRDNLPCDMRKCIDDARAALAALHPQPAPAVAVEAEPRINAKGDWRPIRDALEEAYRRLGRVPGSGGYPQQDWNLAVLMYEAASAQRDTTPCIHCSKRIAWPDAYRCLDCHGVLCERCAPEHFGPKHADRAVAAHPVASSDNLMEEVATVMRKAIDDGRNQDI